MKLTTAEKAEGMYMTLGRLKTAIKQVRIGGEGRALALLEKINLDINDLTDTISYARGALDSLATHYCEKCGTPIKKWIYGEGTEFEKEIIDCCFDCSFAEVQ